MISGTIWSVFHWPLIYCILAPELDVPAGYLFVTSLIGGIGFITIIAWLRLKSGSVWTAVLFHASLNSYHQGIFENLTVETSDHIVATAAAHLVFLRRFVALLIQVHSQ